MSTYYVNVWITEMAGQLLLFISEPDMHKLIILRKGYAIYFWILGEINFSCNRF